MLNNIYHWLILLLKDINWTMDKTLSKVLFTEPINKSNHREVREQQELPKEKLEGTQPTNDWEYKEVVFFLTRRLSLTFFNVPDCYL